MMARGFGKSITALSIINREKDEMKRLYRNCLFKLLATPFTYIVCGGLILFAVLQFFIFQRFFSDVGTSDLHRFFTGIPYICILAIPAVGSFVAFSKDDLSLPFSALEISLAKTLAMLTVSGGALLLTAVVPLAVSFFGDVDMPSVICGYMGLGLYLMATCSFSVFVSTFIENAGFAFIVQAIILAAVNSANLLALYVPMGDMLSSLVKGISFTWHFDAAGKGIIDSRDIVFYLSTSAIMILASTAALELKRGRASEFLKKVAILSVVAFVLVSLDFSKLYFRIDTTVSKQFSVGKYSRSIIDEIEEPMTITYYRSPALKNMYPQVRDIDDFLQTYAGISPRISYSIVDPVKEKLTEKLRGYGIQGQTIPSTGKNSTSYTTVYSAVVISYLGKTETIPFVLSAATLEYNLAEKIGNMIRGTARFVQVVIGNGLSYEEDYAYIKPWLATQGYNVIRTYLPSEIIEGKTDIFTLYPDIPLVVLGTALFTQEDSQALVNFIRGNGKVFLATSPYTVDIKKDWSVLSVNDYVAYDLQEFGIYYRDTITCDKENFRTSFYNDSGASGGTISTLHVEYVDYPMWPALKSQRNAVNGLTMFWPSAIDYDNEVAGDAGGSVESYLRTSKDSWQQKKIDGKFITQPFSDAINIPEGEKTEQYNLAVSLTKRDEKNPSLIATGDQYAYSSEMIGYSSSPSAMDVRGLDFLSSCVLRLSGEDALYELKQSEKSNTSLNKVSLDRLYQLRVPVILVTCIVPLLALAAVAMALSVRRRKIVGRFCK